MKKILIILFCAGVALSVMAGERSMSPEQFRRALANAELVRCPATPGASATAPSLLKRLQGQQNGSFKSRLGTQGPKETHRGQWDDTDSYSEIVGPWIIDSEQYRVERNDDGSYTVGDTCSYARGRAVTLYYNGAQDNYFFGNFVSFDKSIKLSYSFDLPIGFIDDSTVVIPHEIYSGFEVLPSTSIIYRRREYNAYAIPEQWLYGDFGNESGELYGNLFGDGTMYFQDGIMILAEVINSTYRFDPGIIIDGSRNEDGMIVTQSDTTYYCSPLMRNLFLLPSNANHDYIKHYKEDAVPADTTSTGDDDPVVVPGGLGGFGGFGESNVTSNPTYFATTSLHFSSQYGTCGYTGPGTRPPRDKPGKPIDPGGTSRPSSGGGTLPGLSTMSVDGLILGDKLRTVFNPDDQPVENDTLWAPTYMYLADDTTMNVYNLYGLGQMVQINVRPDGTMYMPMQFMGDIKMVDSGLHPTILLRTYYAYNYTPADATLVDLTPGNVGMYDPSDGFMGWGMTAFVDNDLVLPYYYDNNQLSYNYIENRSGEKLSITDIMNDINALRDGNTSLTITDVTSKINRLLHDNGQ